MDNARQEQEASSLLKRVQYLAGLTTQQDVWSEVAEALVNFLGADVVAFGECCADGGIRGHHWVFSDQRFGTALSGSVETLSRADPSQSNVGSEIGEAIAETLESGSVSTRLILTPDPLSMAFLPITRENQVTAVMLVGHRTSDAVSEELLNGYSAVAGLIGATTERLASERELKERCEQLEDLVKERTAELTETAEQLQQEITQRKRAEEALRREHDLAQALEEATASLTATLDPDQVLDRILEQVGHVVPNDAVNLMLVEEAKRVRIVRWRGYERFGAERHVSEVTYELDEVRNLRHMAETGEPMVISDTRSYPGWLALQEQPWLHSYAGAPIHVRGEVVGFLNVDSAVPGFFTQPHAEALRAFASHAAAALESARLYKAEQERRRIAEILRQASTTLNSTLELGEVLNLMLEQLREVIPYDSASVQRLKGQVFSTPNAGHLEIVACQGFERPDRVVGLIFPLDPKFPNHGVLTSRATMAIDDVVQDYPHFQDEADTFESGRIRSWLGVPLIVKDEIIGMIAVDRTDVRPFTADESHLAMAFANQAAIAMENARLYKETQHLATFNEGIIQSMAEGIAVEDADGVYTFANPAGAEMLGYRPDELVGKHWNAIVPPDQQLIVEEANTRRMSGEADRYELEMVHQDGQRVFVLVSGSPRFDAEDHFAGTMAVFTNITDRKRAEQALRKSEQFLHAVFDAIQDGISVLDTDLNVVRTNRWMERMYAHRMPLAGRKCYQAYQERQSPCPWCPTLRTVETGETHTETVPYPSAHDPAGWIELSAFPLKDEQGQVLSVIEYVKDITERKKAEKALRESEQRYRNVYNTAPLAFVLWDRDCCVTDWNQHAEELFGWSREEVLGRNFFEFLIPEGARPQVETVVAALLRGELPSHSVNGNLTKNGEILLCEWNNSIRYDGEGHIAGAISLALDITERQRAEEERDRLQRQLLQAQKMEAVGVLAGGVAHDFNNLLTTIIGNSQLALSDLRRDDPLYEDIEEIKRAGDRGAALSRQLLIFSRKESLRPEVLDVNTIIQDLEKMLRRLIGEDIELVLTLAKDLACVMADPGQMEQVIMNLVVNAREAMPRGGKLTIETASVELDEEYAEVHADVEPGKYVMLAVTDSGCGMNKETLSRVFEPFFTTKEKGKGTGLGLSTVYGIVKQSGGDIRIYSKSGSGTTFKIYLPHTQAEAEIPKQRVETAEELGGKHILVVEDEESVCSLMKRLLSKLGYEVSVAANGGEALLQVEEKGLRPDLLITDVVMPGMSGSVLVERLRRKQPELKVLYMSGYTDETIAEHGELDPGTLFIQKPFNIRDLTEILEEVFREG